MIPDTQAAGWSAIRAVLAPVQFRAWEWIDQHPGHTANEIDRALAPGRSNAAYSRRLSELHDAGYLMRGPARLCAVSGHAAVTWYTLHPPTPTRVKRKPTMARRKAEAFDKIAGILCAVEGLGDKAAATVLRHAREIVSAIVEVRAP